MVTWCGTSFVIRDISDSDIEFKLQPSGNLEIKGTLTEGSDINIKENLVPTDTTNILNAIEVLPIYTWNYINSTADDRHIGAMAQEFYAAFQFGTSDKSLSPRDVAFVAISGIQELINKVRFQEELIIKLNEKIKEIDKLEIRLKVIENKK